MIPYLTKTILKVQRQPCVEILKRRATMLNLTPTLHSEQPIRVFLVDDNRDFLSAMQRFLANAPRIEIAGCAVSGAEALVSMAQCAPDLVILDLVMPGMNGLEVTRRIKAMRDALRVLILTLDEHFLYHVAAKRVGADDFLTKSKMGEQILPLIYRLFARESPPG